MAVEFKLCAWMQLCGKSVISLCMTLSQLGQWQLTAVLTLTITSVGPLEEILLITRTLIDAIYVKK